MAQTELFIKRGETTLNENDDVNRLMVTRSSRLVQAQTKLGARDQKLLAACIALINPCGEYPNGIKVSLTDSQISELTGIDKKNIPQFIDKAAYNFHSVPVATPGSKPNEVDYINIAHRSKYKSDERMFEIHFHVDMEPELLKLAMYSNVYLRELVSMNKKYSMRLFDLLSGLYHSKRGGRQVQTLTLEKLYFQLCLKDVNGKSLASSYTKSFGEFNRGILKPSVKEINDKTGLQIDYQTVRNSRNVTSIRFIVGKKISPTLVSANNMNLSVSQRLEDIGYQEEVVVKLHKKYTEERISANLDYFDSCIEAGQKIVSPPGFYNWLVSNNLAYVDKVANPFSAQYKKTPKARTFIRNILLPLWWKLPKGYSEHLASIGTLHGDEVVGVSMKSFISELESGSSEEDVLLNYELEYTLEGWLFSIKKLGLDRINN